MPRLTRKINLCGKRFLRRSNKARNADILRQKMRIHEVKLLRNHQRFHGAVFGNGISPLTADHRHIRIPSDRIGDALPDRRMHDADRADADTQQKHGAQNCRSTGDIPARPEHRRRASLCAGDLPHTCTDLTLGHGFAALQKRAHERFTCFNQIKIRRTVRFCGFFTDDIAQQFERLIFESFVFSQIRQSPLTKIFSGRPVLKALLSLPFNVCMTEKARNVTGTTEIFVFIGSIFSFSE